MQPYYHDHQIDLYHGNCLEISEWLQADVLITDPPYGRAWVGRGTSLTNSDGGGRSHREGMARKRIAGDRDTSARDAALAQWGERAGIVFGDLLITAPPHAVQCLVYAKAADSGVMGARAGFRRDVEAVYLVGKWPAGVGGRSSVLRSSSWVAGPSSPSARYGHPHAKPLDLMEQLVAMSEGTVADPFAGSGSTLVAARNLGRRAIGVEIDERYCETIARRLDQLALDIEVG